MFKEVQFEICQSDVIMQNVKRDPNCNPWVGKQILKSQRILSLDHLPEDSNQASICRVAGNHRALTNHSIVSQWSVIGRIHCLGELILLGKENFFADELSEEISHFERSTPPKS